MADSIAIRASSIASIIDCPLRGLSLTLGMVDPLPSTAPAAIGTACHEGTAAFDKQRMAGNPVKPDDTADLVVDLIQHPRDEVYWGAMDQRKAERVALGVYTRYCTDIAPIIQYEAVELTLEPLVVDVDDVIIELTGTLDRLYVDVFEAELQKTVFGKPMGGEKGLGVLDVKTGARACSQKPGKHKAQIAVYELLAERTMGQSVNLPGLIGQLQTSSDYEVGVAPVENAQAALLGTDNQIGLIHHIAHMLKTGDFYGNSSSWLCSERYCPLYSGCIFR